MFSNIIPCCRRYLNPNETLYIEIRNECKIYIYVFLQYKLNDKIFTKQSPVFGPGKFTRLTFPAGALNVLFRAYNCKQVPPGILCSRLVSNNISSCYKVTGTSINHIQCIEVPC